MRRVLIESPYAGEVARNELYVRACLRDSLKRGEAPFASHALYTLPGVLADMVPEERRLGIEAGLVWGAAADLTAVYGDFGLTDGMVEGVKRAVKSVRPVELRFVPGWGTSPDDVRLQLEGVLGDAIALLVPRVVPSFVHK